MTPQQLKRRQEIDLTSYKGEQGLVKIGRNLVDYEAGKTILDTALGIERKKDEKQISLFETL